MTRFKTINLHQNRLKIKLFLQKKIQSLNLRVSGGLVRFSQLCFEIAMF